MAADDIGATGTSVAAGVAARAVELTSKVREIEVTNTHATQFADIRIAEGTWAANAAAAAVVGADNLVRVGPMSSKVIYRNRKVQKHVNLSIIASGATTPLYVEGRLWVT